VSDWQTIDESPAAHPIVLRGIPITSPRAYDRLHHGRGGWFTLASLAAGLWKVTSWSASILGHLILMIVLVGLLIGRPPESETLLEVSLYKGKQGDHGKSLKPLQAEKPDEPKPERAPERESASKSPSSRDPVEEPPEELPTETKTPEKTPRNEEKKTPDVVGTGPGSKDRPKDPGNDAGKLIETDPTSATKATRAGDLAKLRRGGAKQIVVVAGTYDRVEQVLQALDVPHTRIEYSELGRYDLAKCLVLLLNCHSSMSKVHGSPSSAEKWKEQIAQLDRRIRESESRLEKAKKSDDRRQIRMVEMELSSLRNTKKYYEKMAHDLAGSASMPEHVRKFVDGGGYLFTSDWGLTLLERLYPDLVANGGGYGPSVVRIAPRVHAGESRLLDGVFVRPKKSGSTTSARELLWDVDSGSYLIRVKSDRVVTLVESPQLPSHRAVAVVFRPAEKSGRVLHVLSHFAKQDDQYGEYALQNLLLNFLLERFEKS